MRDRGVGTGTTEDGTRSQSITEYKYVDEREKVPWDFCILPSKTRGGLSNTQEDVQVVARGTKD